MAIAVYARKSIERENSISCETQIEYCLAMIKPDEKQEEIISYIDNGFSGGNLDREGFQEMMQDIENGKIEKVIVYRLDRISRSLSDFVKILDILKKYDVKFVSSQESFDTSSPYGEMIVKILMVFAEFERRSIIERVTQAYSHRSEKGLYMGGRVPYGFRLTDARIHGIDTKMLRKDEAESAGIEYIFEHYSRCGTTLRGLLNDMLADGVITADDRWSTAKLSVILKNPIYVKADSDVYEYFRKHNTNIVSEISEFDGIHGVQLYGRTKHATDDWSDMKIVVMQHEGTVRSEVWLKCQEKLKKNRQIGNAQSNTTSWLGGVIMCKKCGRKMTVTKGGRRTDGGFRRYFNCAGKKQSRICSGVRVTMYAEILEDIVSTLIGEKIPELSGCQKITKGENRKRINQLKNRLHEINCSEEKILNIMIDEKTDEAMTELLSDKIKCFSDEKRAITKEIRKLECDDSEFIDIADLSACWKESDYEQKKSVCKLFIDRIYIHEDGTIEVMWNC